jgi:hypothetical protein
LLPWQVQLQRARIRRGNFSISVVISRSSGGSLPSICVRRTRMPLPFSACVEDAAESFPLVSPLPAAANFRDRFGWEFRRKLLMRHVVPSRTAVKPPPRRKLFKSLCFRTPPGPSDRGEWPVYCQWRTNVSLVFSIRRRLLVSSAAAPSNETRIAQAPVAERPVALPHVRRWSCKCGSRYSP